MSKSLTRKGLALGALVALASSLFAGSPALAADTMVLAANSTDKTLAAPIDQVLELNASLGAGSTSANIATLKYKVVTDGTFIVKAEASSTGAGPAVVKYTTNSGTSDSTTSNQFKAGETTNVDRVATSVVVAATSSDATRANILKLSVSKVATNDNGRAVASTDTTRSVTVTAFLDANNDNVLDAGETQQEQVVKFVAYKDITTETTITAATAGDTTVTATVKYTNVNMSQLTAANAGAYFTTGTGGDLSATTGDVIRGNVAYSSTVGGFKYTTGTIGALQKDTAVKVQPLLGSAAVSAIGTAANTSAIKVGTAVSLNVTSKTVDLLTGDVVRSTTTSDTNKQVALNSAFTAKWTASLSTLTTTSKVVAGAPVTITVASSKALSSTVTLTVAGTTYTSSTALAAATFTATTDAKGVATLAVSSAGLAAEDTLTFSAKAVGKTAADLVVTQKTATYSAYYVNSPTGNFTTTDGAAVAAQVVVKDQFGGNAPDATYDVSLTLSSSTQTTAATSTSNTYASVVGGAATLTILDNGTGTGVNTYVLSLNKKSTNGQYTSTTDQSRNAVVNIVSDAAASKVVLSLGGTALAAASSTDTSVVFAAGSKGGSAAADNAVLSTGDFAAYNGRNVNETDLSVGTTVDVARFVGTVNTVETSTVAATAIKNALVTVSGAGLQFASTQDAKRVVGVGSLTVYADASGQFQIDILSNLAGKQVVTVTSGSATTKLYVYFAAAAPAAASKVTVKVADGAAQFQAGRALDVTVTVTDKFGNPIATSAIDATATTAAVLRVVQTGSGYLSASGKVVTAADGTYATKLITNAGDLGTSTITATVDFVDTTSTDLVAATSSEFGVTDADVTVGGRAVYASVEFAKGKTVTVTVDGKRLYSKLFSTDAYTELKFTQKKAGKHTVTIRVSGGIVYSETVTTTK